MKKVLLGAAFAIVGVLAVKAATTTAAIPLYATGGGACRAISAVNVGLFSNTGIVQAQATTAAGGTLVPLYRNNTCTLPAFFKP